MVVRSLALRSIGLVLLLVSTGLDARAAEMPPAWTRAEGTPRPTTMAEVKQRLAGLGIEVHRPKVEPAEGTRSLPDLPYATLEAERVLRLDLFLPAQPEGVPLVVLIHGGGWRKGDRSGEHSKAQWLANRGYAAACIEYRLSGEARFPAAIRDCKAAVRWLRARAPEHGYAADRIAVCGGSAGAHLAALLATSAGVADFEPRGADPSLSSVVQCAIVIGGPTDTTHENAIRDSRDPDGNYRLFLGASYDEKPELFTWASPIHHVSETTPPTLIVAENQIDRSQPFLDKLNALGIAHDSLVLTGGVHGEWNHEPWFTITMERVQQFLEQTWPLVEP